MPFIGNQPADKFLTLEKQVFTTSATDTYTLDREVSSVNDIELFLNNVRQEPTEAYTISGTTLTLASAITASDSMYCIYQGRSVGTQAPATGSVTGAMLSKPFNYDSGTLYLDDTNNKIGIGTTSPSSPLHVKTTGSSGTETEVLRLETTGTNDNSGITIDMRTSHINTQIAMVDGTGSYDGMIVFRTASGSALATPLERMRIDGSGGVNIGHPDAVDSGDAGVSFNVASITGLTRFARGGTSNTQLLQFYNANGNVGNITTNGSATAYNTSSDYRLKENVVEMTGATTRVKQLQPKRFNFIADADTTVDGFLAHEVSSVVPEAITGTHNEVDEEGNPVYQGIDQSKLVPLLTASLKEAIAKIEELETRIATLEGN